MLLDSFIFRHIGPNDKEIYEMLSFLGFGSLEDMMQTIIPEDIQLKRSLTLDVPKSEYEIINQLRKLGRLNKLYRSFIGMGYYGTMMPPVIQRNVLENPVWYTSYTPYQAEISQGRMEALLNFQTTIVELTEMEIANSSLLDEASAAAEAMSMIFNLRSAKLKKSGANKFFVDEKVFPQTLEVIISRAEPFGIQIITGDFKEFKADSTTFGALVQYPNSDGEIYDYKNFVNQIHANGGLVAVAADLLALAILKPPGQWGADIVLGTTQRFGLPLAYGGPHAGYFATKLSFVRKIPGRIIGISKDRFGKPALRMTLQTREQHIRREKATSNICTAQALLANLSGFYALYHGYEGLQNIALKVHAKAATLEQKLKELGYEQININYFDTLKIKLPKNIKQESVQEIALKNKINLRYFNDKEHIGISIDEITTIEQLNILIHIFASVVNKTVKEKIHTIQEIETFDSKFIRNDKFMQQDIFKKYRTETKMMRYIKKLERKDISLAHSMIPLGSCTMKLNSAVSMLSLTDPHWSDIHPFVPENQALGYKTLLEELKKDLIKITEFSDICFQPNSGAAGEYTGLKIIRAYHIDQGQSQRDIMLIPASAHGTNPASSAMAGMKVEVIKTDNYGNIDIEDLKTKIKNNKDRLAGLMVTYPSTHGVFEQDIKTICNLIHDNGGLVYLDGANLNAMLGYSNPVIIGADIGHLNLHKTFAIPHGGGGPGVGPIGVVEKLKPYLPSHPIINTARSNKAIKAIAASPFGSPLILTISYAFIKMLGSIGLKCSAEIAVLNANYVAKKLEPYFPIVYKGKNGWNAHETIIDIRPFKHTLGITEIDIAKRLMDFGFHAPTVSFPVVGGLMIEPTESESKEELDRFIEAMIIIYNEIMSIKEGKLDKQDNPIKNAPHPEFELVNNEWNHSYSRQQAAYPADFVKENKFWIPIGRVNDAWGDRNVIAIYKSNEEIKELLKK